MKKILFLILFVTTFLTVNAQNNKTQPAVSPEKEETNDPDNLASQYFSQIMGVAISATSNTKMYKFIYDWLGTPYRLGGNSKKGIDCSGFAFKLYNKAFSTIIGNNSRNIFSMVNPVDKTELKQGDLVFFKIHSRAISHVGVYIGDGKFAHASSSKGVMISNLQDPYWTRYFYKGGRMLESFKDEISSE
jgi:murein DD-endopeptidase / murein LD-carboxypeptidase